MVEGKPFCIRTLLSTSLILCASFLLLGCGEEKPGLYYKFSFEAEVEGEPFTVNTKVFCRPHTYSHRMGLSKFYTVYSADLAAYGMELNSGKGFFVTTPDICRHIIRKLDPPQWGFSGEMEVIPLMFFSDAYGNANHIRLIIDPDGPDPETGVRIISSTVLPFTNEEAEGVETVTPDKNNPLINGAGSKSWYSYSLFPVEEGVMFEKQNLIPLSTGGPFDVYHYMPQNGEKEAWNKLSGRFGTLNDPRPIKENLKSAKAVSSKNQVDYYVSTDIAKWGFQSLHPLEIDGRKFTADFSVGGAIDFYRRYIGGINTYNEKFAVANPEEYSLVFGDVEYRVAQTIGQMDDIIVHDVNGGQYFRVMRINWALNY